MRHSGLQKDVLSLYRSLLRTSTSVQSRQSVRSEFRRHSDSVGRSDFMRIEYLLRKGWKRVKLVEMEGVRGVNGVTRGVGGK